MGALAKSLHLSFLQLSYVPFERIRHPHFIDFLDPSKFYNSVAIDQFQNKRVFVRGVGQCRSPLRPRNLTEKEANYPELDRLWSTLFAVYSNLKTSGGIHFLPYFPAVLDFLPSKQRRYSFDLTDAPSTISSLPPKACRMSASIFYHPLGYVVTKWNVYLHADGYTMDPKDAVSVFRAPKKIRIIVKGKNGEIVNDYLERLIDSLERRFHTGLTGATDEEPLVQMDNYSLIDMVEVSPSIDVTKDQDLIFRFIQSADIGKPDQMPQNSSYGLPTENGEITKGIAMCGERYGFMWGPPEIQPWVAMRYRTFVRNMVMLLLIQKSLSTQVTALESRNWRDQIRSKALIHQLRNGIIGPDLMMPLSIMHYLQVQRTFDQLSSRKAVYESIRSSLDHDDVIGQTTKSLAAILHSVDDEVKSAAGSMSGFMSNAISSAIGRIP